ncbi:DUF937 domain-containing protein [Bradyrhizobium sp. LHD-71]|uniref:DUF937 domain-containing protein n=1 Tax=Bradyrhizobium sp. LHD-71 TaxID=3072141 RepID=UPI00280F59CA|nr:DUF937 domain-containing protein [Bradyrhizobium sp. LHD-71]MDQ8727987.1 DUF937 domain-containing protein [Bradyrhizobium sp. LHD-71]
MAINLVSSIMQSLPPDMITKIASMLGLNPALVQKAVTAGVPAILGSFANLASTPDGANQLSRTLSQQSGALDQLKNAPAGSDQRSFADRGLDMLSGLLGRNGVNTLASAVSTNSGIDANTGKSLVGMLGPVVAGALGLQQKASGLDAGGLASLLTSQKSAIMAAMPQGLASQLGGLLDSIGGQVRSGAETVSNTAGRVGRMTEDTAASASQAARAAAANTPSSLPYWLAGLAALIGLGWYLLSGDLHMAEQPKTSSTVGTAPANVTTADLTNQMRSVVGTLRNDLQTVTDPTSAQSALPKLQQSTDQLDRIGRLSAQLPPTEQKALAAPVNAALPEMAQLFDKILAIPGVAAIAKPTIDALRGKLEALSRA